MSGLIERREIIRIAELAHLALSAEEIDEYQRDLQKFLTSCAKLQKADVSRLEAGGGVSSPKGVLRQDGVEPSLDQKAVLSGSLGAENGFFRVPRIVEGGE